jgi:Ca-activated chloride channel family protein
MTQARKAALKAVVGQLGPQGSTNFAGGLLTGLEHLNRLQLPPNMVRRVIMFTDGLANVGVATKAPDLLRLLEANLGDATVSAFGYGEDADQELLRDLASKGKGNYAFVQSPEDALTAFARELGGLLSTYAREIQVEVRPARGVTLTDVVSDVDSSALPDGAVRIKVPDVLAEELRQIVIGLRVDRRDAPGAMRVADVSGTYRVVAGDTMRPQDARFELEVDVRRVAAGEEQVEPTREVDEAVAMAQLVRAQIQAEERAARGDFDGARQLMSVLYQSARVRGHDVVAEACDRVMHSVSDRASYASSTATRASMRKGFSRSVGGKLDLETENLLARSGRAVKTLAQDAVEKAFGAPKAKPEPKGVPRKPHGAGSLERRRSKRW